MKSLLLLILKWAVMIWVASVVTFCVVHAMPGSPVQRMLFAFQIPETPENVHALEVKWGLDQPLPGQYIIWADNFFRGDWGKSLVTRLDIRNDFMTKLPYSLFIGMSGLFFGALLAYFLGFFAALNQNGFCDKLTRILTLLSQTIPNFILSILVIYFLGVKLRLFQFFTGGRWPALLTAAAFSCLYSTGGFARVVKTHFRSQMREPYLIFAISRGFSTKYVLFFHAGKPALYGLLSVVISRMAWVIGGSSVLEFAFAIPGISYFLVDSMQAKDYYVLQAYVMVIMLWMFVMHLIFRLLMWVLNPVEMK